MLVIVVGVVSPKADAQPFLTDWLSEEPRNRAACGNARGTLDVVGNIQLLS